MSATQVSCPTCKTVLQLAKEIPAGSRLRCTKCGTVFQIKGPPVRALSTSSSAAPKTPTPPAAKPQATPAPSKAAPAAASPKKATSAARKAKADAGGNRQLLVGIALGGGGLLIAGTVLLIVFLTRPAPAPVAQGTPPPAGAPVGGPPVNEPAPQTNALPDNKSTPQEKPAVAATEPAPEEVPGGQESRPVLVAPPADARPMLVLDPGGPSAPVRRALFTPNSRQVILVGADKTARVVDVASGETRYTFRLPVGPGEEGSLFAAALSRDGRALAVGGMPVGRGAHGILIYLVSMNTGQVEKVLRGHTNIITYLDFSHDGRYLASASNDNTARIYEVSSGQTVGVLEGSRDRLRQASWSPDDSRLATVCLDGTVRLWTWATGAVVELHPRRPDAPLLSVAWSPDGTGLATGARDSTLQTWGLDCTLRQDFKLAPGESIQVASLAYTPDGRELLYGGVDRMGAAGIFDLTAGKRRLVFPGHDNTVMHGSISADGKLAVTTGGDRNETFVWRVADGQVVQKILGKGASIFGVGWSKDGTTIAWGNTNRGNTGIPTTAVERTFRPADLEFGDAPGADILRTPSAVNGFSLEALDFFRLAIKKNGRVVNVFQVPLKGDRIYSYSLLDGRRALVGCAFSLQLIELPTGRVLRNYTGHTGAVMGIGIRPTDARYFVTGSQDQTLRIWDPEREQPLLSLFVADQDWIAWTPEGYYAASAYGERLMGWLINTGIDRMALYYPAVQFRKSLYNPEALKLLLQTGSLDKAIAVAAQGKNQPAPTAVSVAQVLPPAVVITAPAGTRHVNVGGGNVQVRAVARSVGSHPVTSMRLLVDGRPWQGEKGIRAFANPRLGEVQADWGLDLPVGAHLLVVQAESAVSKGVSPVVQVTRTAKGNVAPPNLNVLAVGISAYPGGMALKYAHADAQALAAVLDQGTRKVFGHVEIKLLTDQAATRQNIIAGLGWLGQKMTPGDVGIFFFAGHGTQDPFGQCHLVPVDFNPRDPGHTGIPGNTLKRVLANMPGRLIAMLDACHSGAVAGSAGRRRRGRTDDLVRDLVTDDYGVIVMCSSLGREYSLESSATQHGFFTLGILEALSGKADFNHDHLIQVHELDRYACLRVRQLSRGQQNPVTGRPPNVRSFALTGF
jgi:WD40 repeat protein